MSEKSKGEQEKQETRFIPVTVENNLDLTLLYREPTGNEHSVLLRKPENPDEIMDAVKRADSKIGEMYEKARDLSFQLNQLLRDNEGKPGFKPWPPTDAKFQELKKAEDEAVTELRQYLTERYGITGEY